MFKANSMAQKRAQIVGDRIKKLRSEHNMTQDQLADKLHVSRVYISYWENGTRLPGKTSLELMTKIFGAPAEYILGISETKYNIKLDSMFELDMTKLNNNGMKALHEYYLLLINSDKYRREQ